MDGVQRHHREPVRKRSKKILEGHHDTESREYQRYTAREDTRNGAAPQLPLETGRPFLERRGADRVGDYVLLREGCDEGEEDEIDSLDEGRLAG